MEDTACDVATSPPRSSPAGGDARAITCVGTGFIVLDVIRRVTGSGAAQVLDERRHAGGTCGNVLAILAFLGHRAEAVGRVGDDVFGRELEADLRRWGVGTAHLEAEAGRPTPVVLQETYADAHGNPRHRFPRACPRCGARLPGYRPLLASRAADVEAALPPHEVFFFDRASPGTVEFARRSRARGALVVFEPTGVGAPAMFAEALRASDVVKYPRKRREGVGAAVARGRVSVEVETGGAHGLRVRVRDPGGRGVWRAIDAKPAGEVRDASGSGDWCTAGFVYNLALGGWRGFDACLKEEAVVDALRAGQALAALNCRYYGARGMMYARDREGVLLEASGRAPACPWADEAPAPPRDLAPGLCASGLHALAAARGQT